jgi:hypothetical protein
MPTRTYVRASLATCTPDQLAVQIDGALARVGHVVEIEGLAVRVTHSELSASDDPTVNAQISAYTYDPNWGVAIERQTLRSTVPTLRQWAQDARDAVAAWDGQTQAQKNAVLKVLVDRMGTLLDRMADMIHVEDLN